MAVPRGALLAVRRADGLRHRQRHPGQHHRHSHRLGPAGLRQQPEQHPAHGQPRRGRGGGYDGGHGATGRRQAHRQRHRKAGTVHGAVLRRAGTGCRGPQLPALPGGAGLHRRRRI